MAAYPGVKPHHFKGTDRDPDSPPKPNDVLWNVLTQGRHFLAGKRKTQWATDISRHLRLEENKSPSFQAFRRGLAALR